MRLPWSVGAVTQLITVTLYPFGLWHRLFINVLVQGIQGDLNGLAYFGYAYYAANTDKLKIW